MTISPALLAELHVLESAMGGGSLIEYVHRISPRWVEPWHLKPIADLFARAEYGPVRACVSVPPRHGKTELLLHAMPWWLSRHPEQTVAYISYSGGLAFTKSKRALDLAHRAGIILRRDIAKASEWRTPSDGGVISTGIGGPLTGHGANLLIIDDPVKNREEAESVVIRERNWEWFTSTALTRVEPGGSVIVVHTRWHEDDLIGRLKLDRDNHWEIINLPAVQEDGGALWPERWSKKQLDVKKREVGEYDWSSLFMGSPRPKGGRMFSEPIEYDKPDLLNAKLLITCDPAATSKTHSDYSAIVVAAGKLGEDGLVRADILEAYRVQMDIPQLVQLLVRIQKKWSPSVGFNPTPIAVEAVGGFKAVPQMLRQIDKKLRLIEIQPTQDKFTRALPTAAAWNDGRIRCPMQNQPDGRPTPAWLGPFVEEVTRFSGVNDAHDDQVDALAHMYATFAQMLPRYRPTGGGAANFLPFG
jgi:phage terminase large subunit-like protein